jgi:catechol 2,3-dioxygenase-like lactoylglutathione lyase family enzyme
MTDFNHVAVSVPDLKSAVNFYTTCFGFTRLRPDHTHDRTTTPNSPIFTIYGPTLNTVHVAYLASANGIGFEIFQFDSPSYEAPAAPNASAQGQEFAFNRGGFYHVAVTVEDVKSSVAKAVALGGKHYGNIADIGEGKSAAYVRDPWGNVVELLDIGFVELCARKRPE